MTTSGVSEALKKYVESTFLVDLGGAELSTSSNLFAAGVIDSFGVVGIVTFLEAEFGVTFSDEELLSPDLASVDGMARMVEAKRAPR
ncbi:MAG: acyl carrier protein [Holophagales bacterium]|jgi:acyl carrier protein|nr:MAG: acyl carrier protein [Holophagales bacterium]